MIRSSRGGGRTGAFPHLGLLAIALAMLVPTLGCGAPVAVPPPATVDVPLPGAMAPAPAQVVEPSSDPRRAARAVQERSWGREVTGAGFRYLVPAEWVDVDPSQSGSPLIKSTERDPVVRASFMTNTNVASEPFTGDGPEYGRANQIELVKVSTLRRTDLAAAGPRSAMDIEAFWPNPVGVPYITMQRYVSNGVDGFVLTCSAAASVFDDQRAVCERILETFRVEPSP